MIQDYFGSTFVRLDLAQYSSEKFEKTLKNNGENEALLVKKEEAVINESLKILPKFIKTN